MSKRKATRSHDVLFLEAVERLEREGASWYHALELAEVEVDRPSGSPGSLWVYWRGPQDEKWKGFPIRAWEDRMRALDVAQAQLPGWHAYGAPTEVRLVLREGSERYEWRWDE